MATWLRSAVGPGGAILDVGGASGQLAALLAVALGAHVTVLDPEAKLLAHVPEGERVHIVMGVAESIPSGDGLFDAVVATDAFHHFRNQTVAVAEFARVVRAGGAVLVLDPDPRPFAMRLVALGERIVGEPGALLAPEAMRALMASAGIDGECTPEAGAGYRFLGTVRERPISAQLDESLDLSLPCTRRTET